MLIFLATTTVFELYRQRTGHELEEAVQTRFHGDSQVALLGLGRHLLRECTVKACHTCPGRGGCGPDHALDLFVCFQPQ